MRGTGLRHLAAFLCVTLIVVVGFGSAFAQSSPSGIFCGQCGFKNTTSATKCEKCGNPLPKAEVPVEKPAESLPPPGKVAAAASQVFCGNCGQANAEGTVFCSRCNNKLPLKDDAFGVSSKLFCGQCGTENSITDQFCGNCGFALHQDVVVDAKPKKGTSKLSIGAWFTNTSISKDGYSTDVQTVSVMLAYGIFFTNHFEVGAELTGTQYMGDGGSSFGQMDFCANLTYYFIGESNFVPYLGIKGGVSMTSYGAGGTSQDDSNGSFGGRVGANVFIGKSSNSIFFELDGDGGESSVSVTVRTGMNFYFN